MSLNIIEKYKSELQAWTDGAKWVIDISELHQSFITWDVKDKNLFLSTMTFDQCKKHIADYDYRIGTIFLVNVDDKQFMSIKELFPFIDIKQLK